MRRTSPDVRIEITPMIDVVFLLLTFFIFSIVLMVRADVLDVQLPSLGAGQSADAVVPITVAITENGEILVNRESVADVEVIERLEALRSEFEGAPIVLAVDTRSSAGVLLDLVDRLTAAGMDSFSIIGEREAASEQGEAQQRETEPSGTP